MKRTRHFIGSLAAALVCLPVAGKAQERTGLGDASLRLVVEIIPVSGERTAQGTGIVARAEEGRVQVVTAGHVLLFDGARPTPAEGATICFYREAGLAESYRCPTVEASSMRRLEGSGNLSDVAVITIDGVHSSIVERLQESLNRLGNLDQLAPGDAVTALGCGVADCWQPRAQDRVVLKGDSEIGFASFSVVGGDSGGPLFNEWGEVVGMNVKIGEGGVAGATALRIDHVLDTARVVGLTDPGLSSPAIPRQGYPTSVGVTLTKAGSDPVFPGEDRFPSMRILLHRTLIQDPGRGFRVDGHVGFNRIAADNLSSNGGVLGVSVGTGVGILGGRAFLEVGGSRVTAREAVDTLVIGGVPTPTYERLEGDGLGFGAGVVVDAIVFKHTVLEATAGYWNFTRPEGAPEFPSIVFGLGVRGSW